MILGIDYGRTHLGLAISEGEIAEPLGTIEIREAGSEIKEIEARVKKLGIRQIIVGISEGKMAEETKTWGENLGKVLELPVEFVDEALTTVEAGRLAGGFKYKKGDHARTAAVILQRYLDEIK